MRSLRSVALLLPLLVIPARADEAISRRHFERAKALVELGDHRAAIKEFELAFQANPRSSLLYNIAQQHRILAEAGAVEEMRRAAEFFERYLDAEPRAPDREQVEGCIADLRARIASAEVSARRTAIQVDEPAPRDAGVQVAGDDPKRSRLAPPEADPPPASAPGRRYAWVWVAATVGAAVVVGLGVGLGVGRSRGGAPETTLGDMDVVFP